MFDGFFEIFKAGKHTDAAGNVREWTETDLDKIVASYDPAKHEAPVVVGHPKDNTPAFAWVESLKREGMTLLAKVKDVVPEFAEAVGQKLYKKRSIALYPDLSLRHIGFLGGMPPAVKGLADLNFAEEDGALEYMDWEDMQIAELFSGLREFLIDKFDLETADKVLPAWTIDQLKTSAAQPEMNDCPECGCSVPEYANYCTNCGAKMKAAPAGADPAFAEPDPAGDPAGEPDPAGAAPSGAAGDPPAGAGADPAPSGDPAGAGTGEHSESEEVKALRLENDRLKRESRAVEFRLFCDDLTAAGKLPPALKNATVEFLEMAHGVTGFEFAEAGDLTAVERLKAFLQAMPKRLPDPINPLTFEEGGHDGEDPKAIAAAALEYQEKQRSIGNIICLAEAVQTVQKNKK